MRLALSMLTALLVSVIAPAVADAAVYNIHMGGMCSTSWTEGKGSARLGNWNDGSISVQPFVDQRNNMSQATTQFAAVLDAYCTGDNLCYVYTYSNGGAVLSRTLSIYSTPWNIAYAGIAGSNEGGSEIGGTGWVGEIFGGCTLAGHIGVSDHRNGWNHHDTNGVVMGHVGGNGWMFPYAQHAVLPGHDDGAVAHHSAGGYSSAGSRDSLCEGGQFANHQTWWSCEYGDDDHYELKMRAVCNDGGC